MPRRASLIVNFAGPEAALALDTEKTRNRSNLTMRFKMSVVDARLQRAFPYHVQAANVELLLHRCDKRARWQSRHLGKFPSRGVNGLRDGSQLSFVRCLRRAWLP